MISGVTVTPNARLFKLYYFKMVSTCPEVEETKHIARQTLPEFNNTLILRHPLHYSNIIARLNNRHM